MISQGYHRVLAILLAVALALGAIPASGGAFGAPVANPPVTTEYAQHSDHRTDAAPDNHAHAHDDAAYEKAQSGHSHGDGPADHSHEKPAVLASPVRVIPVSGEKWLPVGFTTLNLETSQRLDRPPRLSVAH